MDTEGQDIIYNFSKVEQLINTKQLSTTNYLEKYLYTKRKHLTKITVLGGQLRNGMVTSKLHVIGKDTNNHTNAEAVNNLKCSHSIYSIIFTTAL
jgi:hypothetical protein